MGRGTSGGKADPDPIAERYGVSSADVPEAFVLRPERLTLLRVFAVLTAMPGRARRLSVTDADCN